jgi:hypothetical protein
LNKEISELKRNIILQNQNIVKELELLDATRLSQMRKLIGIIGINNYNSFSKIDEYMNMRP